MSRVIEMGGTVVGVLNPSTGKVQYDKDAINTKIQEMIAGQQPGAEKGKLQTSVRISYRYDKHRIPNNDAIYKLWKSNPLVQNRIVQLNSLVFGRGFNYAYDENTQKIIDRFWRLNRLRSQLNPIMTDSQLYGETFIGLFPQASGDVLIAIYDPGMVHIDFNPANINDIREYIVVYKDEETGKDEQLKFKPAYQYLNEIEFATPISKAVTKVKNALSGNKGIPGFDGLMIHVKFNNSSSEVHGTSCFTQTYGVLCDYMDFRGDRLLIHQMYGSPMFDITIDTDDPQKIRDRIDELASFQIGSNPVHNTSEEWKPLEFSGTADNAQYDEDAMRGLICAGFNMPEHMVFNQSRGKESQDGTFALNKVAEDMQDAFGDAFIEMHKVAVAFAGGDIAQVENGQLIFPEISTMSEKAKAETYVLKVGAQICSRETASYNTGHNWAVEKDKISDEMKMFNPLANTEEGGGIMGGRFSSKINNQDPDRDNGEDDRIARGKASNIRTQTFGNRKSNN